VAALRPRFGVPGEPGVPGGVGELPAAVRLADGPRRPRLICLATPMVGGGVHQHARLAAEFRGLRHVSALPLPGFGRGEPLPGSAEALARVLADAVLKAADDE